MAVDLTLKGVHLTNREATPRVLNNPGLGGGSRLKAAKSQLASVTAALSITSIIRLVEVPSSAIVEHLWFQSAAQGAGAFNIGVYRTNKDGGAVVDADLFVTEIDCAGAVVLADVVNQSTNYTIAKQCQPLWQAAGLTTDPHTGLDIALTVAGTDVTTGTGAVLVLIEYVD